MSNHDYRKIIEEIARRNSAAVSVFADFCRMGSCALAMGSREAEYLEVAGRYTRDELSDISRAFALLVQEMEASPFTDILGPYYIEVVPPSSQKSRGEFYTPPEISRLMARMVVDPVAEKATGNPFSLNEPACGSGSGVLAVAELFAPDSVDLLRVTAQDINPVAADMAYINLTLWGIPARIVLGDTIRMTVTAEWKNLHWHRVGEDQRLKFQRLRELIETPPEPSPEVVSGNAAQVSQAKGQLLFNF